MAKNYTKSLTISLVLVSGILCGYILAVVALVFPLLAKKQLFDSAQISLLAGSLLLGFVFASVYTGLLADWLGRRLVIIITSIVFIIGIVGFVLYDNYWSLYLFRTIQGIAYGMCEIVIPLYLVEVSEVHLRGKMITAFKVANTLGALVSSLMWLILPTAFYVQAFCFALILSAVLGFITIFLPESPRWLIYHSKEELAKKALNKICSTSLQAEFIAKEIKESMSNISTSAFRELFRSKATIMPFIVVTAILALVQLSGINFVVQNNVQILNECGITSHWIGLWGSISINAINFIGLLVTFVAIEKLGRRLLLLIGTVGVTVMLVFLSLVHYIVPQGVLLGYFTLILLVLFVGFCAMGSGGVVLVVISEILPNKVRSFALSLAFTIAAIIGTAFISWFGKLSIQIGYANLFMIMAGFSLIYLLIIIYLIPETTGKTLEEIKWNSKKREA